MSREPGVRFLEIRQLAVPGNFCLRSLGLVIHQNISGRKYKLLDLYQRSTSSLFMLTDFGAHRNNSAFAQKKVSHFNHFTSLSVYFIGQ